MKSIFLLSGYIVKAIGLLPAIFLAFMPLIIYTFFLRKKGVKISSNRYILISYFLTLLFCFLISTMFFMTAMSLGVWG